MQITPAGTRTAQQEAWLDDALAGLLYDYEHPALPCSVTVRWATQETLQGLGDHGSGVYFAFTVVSESTLSATIRIWDGLDTNTGRFSGKDFYMETIAHELGHVVAGVRSTQHPTLQSEFATMVSGSGSWTGGTWEERYLEAFAEIFKDVFFPGRKFDNRTAHKLNRGRFDAYLDLVNMAEESSTAPHIDYDVAMSGFYHGSDAGLWGQPFVTNVGYPFYWAVNGEPGNPLGWPEGITGGTFTPRPDRGVEFSTLVAGFDLTMTPDFALPYATNDDLANPPPPDPEYNADNDPANWQYVGWGNGWWNADFGIGEDPSGYSASSGRRIRNNLFWYTSDIESSFGGQIPGDARGGPLFFLRWELVDPLTYLTEPDAIQAQALLDANYSHFEPLIGQVPQFSGALASPPNLRDLGFTADCPVQLRIGTEAIAQITALIDGVETEVNGGQIGDARPAGPGVTEEWHNREFTVTFRYRFPDPSWPYPTSITVAIPNGPKTRRVQYAGNGWANRRGTNRRFVGVPSPTVNLDE